MHNKKNIVSNIGRNLSVKQKVWTSHTITVKAEVPNTFFIFVFTSTAGLPALGTKIQLGANTEPLPVKEELMCELSQEFDPL